tara:strand:- start:1527 stop:1820 length:294 start_codon:yes stop_codon:yes gene_type:complete
MKLKETYRAYIKYKDINGNKLDLSTMNWPFDTYRIVHAESVSECMSEFKRLYPELLMLGVAGTADLSDKILIDLIEKQGHKPKYIKTKKLKDLLDGR